MSAYDLLIINGRVLDGAGNPWQHADVGVRDGRIVALGRLRGQSAARTLDADGHFVAPGFIDLHTHSDLSLLAEPRHEPKVRQGITTEVIGHDGLSYAPVDDAAMDFFRETVAPINGRHDLDYSWRSVAQFLDRHDGNGAVNVAYLLPHGPIRMMVMGPDARVATDDELAQMARLVDQGMREGAIGFSTGLTYAPCLHADTRELVALCRASAQHDSVFMPHLRSYGVGVMEAMEEALEIARASGIPLHLTHHQVVFPINRDRHEEYTAIIDRARSEGLDVTCDSYPYAAGSTSFIGMFPGWAQGQGRERVLALLQEPESDERMRVDVEVTGCDGTHGVAMDWSKVQISGVTNPDWRPLLGRRVADVAAERGQSTWAFVRELLLANEGQVNMVSFFGHEHAIRHIMQHPTHMVGSDGILVGDSPHPRVYGTFPRYLGHYTRELGILTWEQAVRKMTGASAQRIGLVDRGLIKVGFAADITLFNPDTVIDRATFEQPKQYPDGIPYVIVNGEVVVDAGEHTGATPGRALRRGQVTPPLAGRHAAA